MITARDLHRGPRRWRRWRFWRRRRWLADQLTVDATFWSIVEQEWKVAAPESQPQQHDVPLLALPLWPFTAATLSAFGFFWSFPFH